MLVGPRNRWRLAAAVVLGLAAALFFARLGERSLWSEEVRWAQIPREMQRDADYFWPTFNGRVYYDKPLGSYWLVLAAARFTGAIDELSARLPSAISGLTGVALVMLLARHLYGRRTAVLAGAILATTFGYTFFARTASADAETVTGVLAALWLFVRNEGRSGGRWTLAFWLVMALTSLTKGLLGFALPLLVAVVYSTWTGLADVAPGENRVTRVVSANRWLFNRWTLAAAPLAVLAYLAPFLLSGDGVAEGLKMVFRENIRRFFDPVNHRGPVYLYAYVVFELTAPWAVLLPAALVRAHTAQPGGRIRRGDRFALVYFWATFVFFTLASSRRSYYLLPILPAGALLVAALLARPAERQAPAVRGLRRVGVALFAVAVLAAPVALIPLSLRPCSLDRFPALPALEAFITAWAVAVIALAWAVASPPRVGVALAVATFAAQAYLFIFALPAVDADRTQRAFAGAVRERLGADVARRLALYRTREIVYYLDPTSPLPEFHTPEDFCRAVANHEVRWVILRRRDRDAVGDHYAELACEAVSPWDGPDQAGVKLLLLKAPE